MIIIINVICWRSQSSWFHLDVIISIVVTTTYFELQRQEFSDSKIYAVFTRVRSCCLWRTLTKFYPYTKKVLTRMSTVYTHFLPQWPVYYTRLHITALLVFTCDWRHFIDLRVYILYVGQSLLIRLVSCFVCMYMYMCAVTYYLFLKLFVQTATTLVK